MSEKPVVVVSGFLGAGKTSLLEHLLAEGHGIHPGLLVNTRSSPDGGARVPTGRPGATPRPVIEMTDGCLCCTRRDEFVRDLARLADDCDFLMVEALGLGEPLAVARALVDAEGPDQPLAGKVAPWAMATVVDARHFLDNFRSAATLEALGLADGDDPRRLAELLIDQVESANVLVVNKADRATAEELSWLTELLGQLNPQARVVLAEHGRVDAEELLSARLFDWERMLYGQGWLRALAGEPPPSGAHGLSSWVYRARRPFHPQRLARAVARLPWREVLRSKGFVWLATRPDVAGLWNQAGRVFNLEPAGQWWAGVPLDDRPAAHAEDWDPEHGDRRQEIAFLGQDMNTEALRRGLDSCLLSDAEMAGGEPAWRRFTDPFPGWDLPAARECRPTA